MRRFVGDARDFRKPGERRVLVLTADLLDELGVAGCGRDDQERAVKQWLADNEPNKVLALSLSEDGSLDTTCQQLVKRTTTDRPGRRRTNAPENAADLHQHGRRRTHPDIRNS